MIKLLQFLVAALVTVFVLEVSAGGGNEYIPPSGGKKGEVRLPEVKYIRNTPDLPDPVYNVVLEQDEKDWRVFRLRDYQRVQGDINEVITDRDVFLTPEITGVYGQVTLKMPTVPFRRYGKMIAVLYDQDDNLTYVEQTGGRGIYQIHALPGQYRLCLIEGMSPLIKDRIPVGGCMEIEVTNELLRCDMESDNVKHSAEFDCRNEPVKEFRPALITGG